MIFKTETTPDGIVIASVAGTLDRRAAGPLCDALSDCVACGARALIVDLGEVTCLTRAGSRGLVVAARLLHTAGGRMRICAAARPVETLIHELGYDHLLFCDADHATSVARLRDAPAAWPGLGPVEAVRTTFDQLVGLLRVEYARHLVETGAHSLPRIAETCGYADADALRQALLDHLGFAPMAAADAPTPQVERAA